MEELKGVWIVISYDMTAQPLFVEDNEIDARRHLDDIPWANVKFWEFGKEWSNN